MAYEHLDSPENTSPGLSDSIFVAFRSDFATNGVKAPVAPFTSPGDKVTIVEDHEFKEGKHFSEITCAPFKNQLEETLNGDPGSIGKEQNLTIFVPGSYEEQHERMSDLLNKPLIVLVKDVSCDEGKVYQLGSKCTSAWITNSQFTTGQARGGGQKGYNITITFVSNKTYIYKGAIQLSPTEEEAPEVEG